MEPGWALCTALLGGTSAMRLAGKQYLPQWPNEATRSYEQRLAVAVCHPAFKRTVTTLAAKPFSKPLTLTDETPDQVKEWADNIDLEGRNLHSFAADLMELALGPGLAGILVEFQKAQGVPTTEAGVRTVADEKKAGLRPYFIEVKPHQILGWRAALSTGVWQLMQLRIMECVSEADGEFDEKTVHQVRVLEPGRWATYRPDPKQPDEWVLHDNGVTSLDFIPFVPVYGQRTGFMTAQPPLLELAHLNVAHWQSASDQQTILHVARVPILTAKNVQDQLNPDGTAKPWELTIGAGAAVRISGPDAQLSFTEHSGKAIEAGAKDLEALEERMRQAGAELLVITPGSKTRIEAAADNEVAMCTLQRITLHLQDALNLALDYAARWVNLESAGAVTLFTDFGFMTLAQATAELVKDMASAGQISNETAFREQQRRGILSPDMEWEDEQARLESQGPTLGALGIGGANNGGGQPDPAAP